MYACCNGHAAQRSLSQHCGASVYMSAEYDSGAGSGSFARSIVRNASDLTIDLLRMSRAAPFGSVTARNGVDARHCPGRNVRVSRNSVPRR